MNDWVNTREAGDYYDVRVMVLEKIDRVITDITPFNIFFLSTT